MHEPPMWKRKNSPVSGKQLNDRMKVTRHVILYDQDVDNAYVMLELLHAWCLFLLETGSTVSRCV